MLATALGPDHWPYASLITVACDTDGSPILLLSKLAAHTQNIDRDPRCSLLFEAASRLNNPQTGARTTLLGRICPVEDERLSRRFLARHPGAMLYAGFTDFHTYRMSIERAHIVGGFARARWLEADDVILKDKDICELATGETPFLERLNRDYQHEIQLLAAQRLKRAGTNWTVIGIDTDGLDLRRGHMFARLDFDNSVRTWSEMEQTINQLMNTVEPDARRRES